MFNAEEESIKLRTLQQVRRKRKFQPSKLDPYKHQLLALHRIGESLSQLQLFLSLHNVSVARSTIHYWLKKHGDVCLIG